MEIARTGTKEAPGRPGFGEPPGPKDGAQAFRKIKRARKGGHRAGGGGRCQRPSDRRGGGEGRRGGALAGGHPDSPSSPMVRSGRTVATSSSVPTSIPSAASGSPGEGAVRITPQNSQRIISKPCRIPFCR